MRKVKVLVKTDKWTEEKARELATEGTENRVSAFDTTLTTDGYITPSAIISNAVMFIMMRHEETVVDDMLNWLEHGLLRIGDGEVDEEGNILYRG